MVTWLWIALLLCVSWIGVVIGYRYGRYAGITEGYGMAIAERRRRKSDVFSRMYGGQPSDWPSSMSGGGSGIGGQPDRRSK